ERLMPQLRQQSRARMESCPDADLLASFAQDQVSPFVKSAITEHLSQCRECSEICARLLNFDATNASAQDGEWQNADKRLGNWMEGFLQERAPKEEPVVTRWTEAPRTSGFWKFGWVLGAVAVLALAVGTLVMRRTHPPTAVQAPGQTPAPALAPSAAQ